MNSKVFWDARNFKAAWGFEHMYKFLPWKQFGQFNSFHKYLLSIYYVFCLFVWLFLPNTNAHNTVC